MYARNVTLHLKANAAAEFTRTPEKDVLPVLRKQNGFRDELAFVGAIQRLREAGLTPRQIFRAATLSNAEAFGLGREIGTVATGKRANLLLLRKDPTLSVEAYDDIVKVILHGRVLDRAELTADFNVGRR